ncbi:MAG: hypothetical protein PWP39_414 [Pyrococcus sp.]|nr:hypothetical protein [Pyrococcus sp.]
MFQQLPKGDHYGKNIEAYLYWKIKKEAAEEKRDISKYAI